MQFKIFDLGLIDFIKAWQFQKEIFEEVKGGYINCALIFCQHYPVITLGRSSNRKNILIPEEELQNRGIKIYEIERAGDVTYHGPGQVMVYPIFNLNYLKKDIHWFLRQLEDVIIGCLLDFRIKGKRRNGLTGVWIGKQKVASIGIAIRNWITLHGLSINIKREDLANFNLIRPCGMDIQMTALEKVLERDLEIDRIKENLTPKFRDVFSAKAKGVPYAVMMGTPFRLLPKTSLKEEVSV